MSAIPPSTPAASSESHQLCMSVRWLPSRSHAQDVPLNQSIKAACTLCFLGALVGSHRAWDWGCWLEGRNSWLCRLSANTNHSRYPWTWARKVGASGASTSLAKQQQHLQMKTREAISFICFLERCMGEDSPQVFTQLVHYTFFYFLRTGTRPSKANLTISNKIILNDHVFKREGGNN